MNRHGIRIVYQQVGSIGEFEFFNLILNILAAIALFSIAHFLVTFMMLFVLPERKIYRSIKYHDVAIGKWRMTEKPMDDIHSIQHEDFFELTGEPMYRRSLGDSGSGSEDEGRRPRSRSRRRLSVSMSRRIVRSSSLAPPTRRRSVRSMVSEDGDCHSTSISMTNFSEGACSSSPHTLLPIGFVVTDEHGRSHEFDDLK